jgi:FlaA1/EpsC-like NDP-sugar epimerase
MPYPRHFLFPLRHYLIPPPFVVQQNSRPLLVRMHRLQKVSQFLSHTCSLSYSVRSVRGATFLDSFRSPALARTMSSAMTKRLEGKTIVITGASSGIGRSTAFEFARTAPKNLKLILTARRIDTLKQVAEDIKKEVGEGVQVLPVQLDVSKPEDIKSFIGKLPSEFKNIDVLVNNA